MILVGSFSMLIFHSGGLVLNIKTHPMWTGIFLVTHELEMDQAAGGFVSEEWEIFGNEYYAKKEWVTTSASEGLLETGTFKLYHRPQS